MGAGLTTIAVSTEALPVYAAALESVMVKSISATNNAETRIAIVVHWQTNRFRCRRTHCVC
jgi:NAD(P)H-hydrate repair Nnr-like enzyme with NAD(P)H-hydrate dehydratase domain